MALRSLFIGDILMRENTYLFFNVFYFVLGYISAEWYKVFKTCGLDDQCWCHTHTHTHEIFTGFLHIFGFIILYVIVQVFCCIILFTANLTSGMTFHIKIFSCWFHQRDHVGIYSKIFLEGFACSSFLEFLDLCNFCLYLCCSCILPMY